MPATILGGRGFIGRHLAAELRRRGNPCWLPERDDTQIFQRPLGCVYYCIGLTADFRQRPYATIDAHIGVLRQLLERADFEQLIYLSSTRVYAGGHHAEEDRAIPVATFNPDELYNLSKLMGESLALSCGRACRVARLSNVLGPDMGPTNFVGALTAEARASGRVRLRTALASEKDYLWIDDAVAGLVAIAERGSQPIYNLAAGRNVSHGELTGLLSERGIAIEVAEQAPVTRFPVIPTRRLEQDTGFRAAPVLPLLARWLDGLFAPGDDRLDIIA